jgi:hypothetical protein
MELGSIYHYYHAVEQEWHFVFVYDVSYHTIRPALGEHEGLNLCAIAVNIRDSSDIRKIPDKYWGLWTKV